MADSLLILSLPRSEPAPTATDAALYDVRFQCADLLHLVSGAIHNDGRSRDLLIGLALDRSAKMKAALARLAEVRG